MKLETCARPDGWSSTPSATVALGTRSAGVPSTNGSAPRAVVRWLRVLLQTLWLLLGIGVLLASVAAARGITAPGDFMYSDGVQLYHTLRVRDGLPLYIDVAEPPYLALPYWPLVMTTAGTIARLAQLDVLGTLYVVRGLATVGAVASALSIGALATICGASRRGAVAAGGLFLTAYVIHPWAYAARTDLPGLGLVMGGLVVLLRTRGWRGAAIAGLLMGAAFTCKQTFVVGVTSASLVLLWRREWARLFALTAAWAVFVGVTTAMVHVVSEGRFITQALSGNVMPWRIQNVSYFGSVYLAMTVTILALAAYGWRPAVAASAAGWTLSLHGTLALLFALATIGRVGAYYNYLIEATAVLAVFAGLGLERCSAVLEELAGGTQTAGRPAVRTAATVGVLALAVGGYGLPLLAIGLMAADPPDRTRLIAALRDAPGPVLTQKDALAVVLAGKEPIAGDPYGVAIYAQAGTWDPASLNDLVRGGSFALVALNRPVEEVVIYDDLPWWPPGTRELIQERYRLDRQLDGFYLYAPASASAAGSAALASQAGPHSGAEQPDVAP